MTIEAICSNCSSVRIPSTNGGPTPIPTRTRQATPYEIKPAVPNPPQEKFIPLKNMGFQSLPSSPGRLPRKMQRSWLRVEGRFLFHRSALLTQSLPGCPPDFPVRAAEYNRRYFPSNCCWLHNHSAI